jgi:hypothetical protein
MVSLFRLIKARRGSAAFLFSAQVYYTGILGFPISRLKAFHLYKEVQINAIRFVS